MVKIVGPALSLDAGGTIKKTLIFQARPGGHFLARYHKPGSRSKTNASTAQLAQRALVGQAVAAWHELTPEQQAEYN